MVAGFPETWRAVLTRCFSNETLFSSVVFSEAGQRFENETVRSHTTRVHQRAHCSQSVATLSHVALLMPLDMRSSMRLAGCVSLADVLVIWDDPLS